MMIKYRLDAMQMAAIWREWLVHNKHFHLRKYHVRSYTMAPCELNQVATYSCSKAGNGDSDGTAVK